LALIVIVLLQTGKGSDIGSAFGGASQTVFGSGGRQTFMSRLTAGAAVVFMVTCLFLAWYSSKTISRGVMKDFKEAPAAPPVGAQIPQPGAAPAAPAPVGAQGEAIPSAVGGPAPAAPVGAPQAAPTPAGPAAPSAPGKPARKGEPPQLP
jgi:preprotein translocase subunit SecG